MWEQVWSVRGCRAAAAKKGQDLAKWPKIHEAAQKTTDDYKRIDHGEEERLNTQII